MAVLDATGAMCAIGDVGPAYNMLPLAVTNVEGTDDMASADQYGWILPYALTRNGELSRATAVRALRECINFAVEESELRPYGSKLGFRVWGRFRGEIWFSFFLYCSAMGNCVAGTSEQRGVHTA